MEGRPACVPASTGAFDNRDGIHGDEKPLSVARSFDQMPRSPKPSTDFFHAREFVFRSSRFGGGKLLTDMHMLLLLCGHWIRNSHSIHLALLR